MAVSMRSTVHIHWLVPSAAAVSTLTLRLLSNFLLFNSFFENYLHLAPQRLKLIFDLGIGAMSSDVEMPGHTQ